MELRAAVKSGLDNLTNFEGRATRSEFWWYWAAIAVPAIILSLIFSSFIPLVGALIGLAATGLAFSAAVRRLHDSGRPGMWMVPFVVVTSLLTPRGLYRPVFGGLGAGAPGELCGSGHPDSRGLGGAVLFGPAQRYRLQPVRSAAGIAGVGPPRKGSRRDTTMRIPRKS